MKETLYTYYRLEVEIHLDICVSPYFERVLSNYFRNSLQVFLKYSARKNCVLKFKFLKSKRKISKLFIFSQQYILYEFSSNRYSNWFFIPKNHNLHTQYSLPTIIFIIFSPMGWPECPHTKKGLRILGN